MKKPINPWPENIVNMVIAICLTVSFCILVKGCSGGFH